MNRSFTETEIRSMLDKLNLLPHAYGRKLFEICEDEGDLAEIIFCAMSCNQDRVGALESLRTTISTLEQAIRLIEEIQNEHH